MDTPAPPTLTDAELLRQAADQRMAVADVLQRAGDAPANAREALEDGELLHHWAKVAESFGGRCPWQPVVRHARDVLAAAETQTATPTTKTGPMSRRDVWLTVALAVAQGRMTEPDEIRFMPGFDGRMPYVTVRYNTMFGTNDQVRPVAETLRLAAQAAAALSLTDRRDHPDGIARAWTAYGRDGWVWEVEAGTPAGSVYEAPECEPSDLADAVLAAVGGAS